MEINILISSKSVSTIPFCLIYHRRVYVIVVCYTNVVMFVWLEDILISDSRALHVEKNDGGTYRENKKRLFNEKPQISLETV